MYAILGLEGLVHVCSYYIYVGKYDLGSIGRFDALLHLSSISPVGKEQGSKEVRGVVYHFDEIRCCFDGFQSMHITTNVHLIVVARDHDGWTCPAPEHVEHFVEWFDGQGPSCMPEVSEEQDTSIALPGFLVHLKQHLGAGIDGPSADVQIGECDPSFHVFPPSVPGRCISACCGFGRLFFGHGRRRFLQTRATFPSTSDLARTAPATTCKRPHGACARPRRRRESARTSFHRYLSHLHSQSLETSRSHRPKVSIPGGMVSMDGCARGAPSKGRRQTRRRIHVCEARACSCACTSLSSPSTRAPTSRFVARSARDARFGWRKRPWRMWTDGSRS